MRRTIILILLIAFTMISTAQAAEYYTKYKGDKRKGEATDDMALVYVFRPSAMGAAIKTWAFADDQLLGVSKGKGYFFDLVPPGERIIWGKAENTSAVEVDLEAGRTYYFKATILPGIGKARVKLVQVDEAMAEKFLKKCSYCEPSEEGRQRATEIAANRMERAEKKAAKRSGSDK